MFFFFFLNSTSRLKMCAGYVLTCDQYAAEAQQGELIRCGQVKLHSENWVNELQSHTLFFLYCCSSYWELDFPERRKFPEALSLSIGDKNKKRKNPRYLASVRNTQDTMTNKLWLLFIWKCPSVLIMKWSHCFTFSPHEQYKDPKTPVFLSCFPDSAGLLTQWVRLKSTWSSVKTSSYQSKSVWILIWDQCFVYNPHRLLQTLDWSTDFLI